MDYDYLDPNTLAELTTFLESVKFSKKSGRSTATFGKKYKYMGGDDEPLGPIPSVLQPIFDKFNEGTQKNSNYKLNSCLINKYEGNKSWLPEHSDDEPWIHPTSQIFTISIGGTRNIIYKNINSGNEHTVSCPTNSLYTMSRASQEMFLHRMDVDENADDVVRYSFTFRRVHWSYMNSTYALGDSNFGKIKFGKQRGQVGKATPGARDFAAKVESIDPIKCMSYRNVVLMCGTNDLKEIHQSKLTVEDDIRDIYKLYKLKISQIRELNSKCKIIICPVLPSLDRDLNCKIGFFNSLLRSDLSHSNLTVDIVQGFRQFVDPITSLLRRDLHNGEPRDTLHLGRNSGVPLLVRLIKLCIFSFRKRGNKMTSGQAYANAVRGPPTPA